MGFQLRPAALGGGVQGGRGVYLYHLSPSEPDNVLQISFP